MALEKIEVADLEVQEHIKIVDAAFTWPHPSDKGYFVSAIFVHTTEDKPYLIYCPRATTTISINEETHNSYLIWEGPAQVIKQIRLDQTLSKVGDILFYIIALEQEERKVNKREIEELFGIKVVE